MGGYWTKDALEGQNEEEQVAAVQEMVERGINLNQTDRKGRTPLYRAVELQNVHLVQNLVEHQDVDVKKPAAVQHFIGRPVYVPPLCQAVKQRHLSIAKLLCEHGADVNCMNYDGLTPLSLATEAGQVEMCKLLLQYGAEVNSTSSMLFDPLHWACAGGHVQIAQILLDNDADINVKKCRNEARHFVSPLHVATENGHNTLSTNLITAGADIKAVDTAGQTTLMKACRNGLSDVIKLLLARNCDVNVSDSGGNTCLQHALQTTRLNRDNNMNYENGCIDDKGNLSYSSTAIHKSVLTLHLLLEAGASWSKPDCFGVSCLERCIMTDNIPALVVFIKHGAFPKQVLMSSCNNYFSMDDISCLIHQLRNVFYNKDTTIQEKSKKLVQFSSKPFHSKSSLNLQKLCRRTIRNSILINRSHTKSVLSDIETLLIPKSLKAFLMFSEVDEMKYDLSRNRTIC